MSKMRRAGNHRGYTGHLLLDLLLCFVLSDRVIGCSKWRGFCSTSGDVPILWHMVFGRRNHPKAQNYQHAYGFERVGRTPIRRLAHDGDCTRLQSSICLVERLRLEGHINFTLWVYPELDVCLQVSSSLIVPMALRISETRRSVQ